jgi:SAM-dependent methyltransferase
MENREHWERIGSDYGLSWDPPAKDWLSREELDFVSRHLPVAASVVMDVGVGSGRVLERLLESTANARVFGVDVADSMVTACRTRFALEGRVAALSVCDVSREALPFDINFDFITAIRVLKYSKNWPDVVARLAARLNPGATLVFSMPNRHSISRFSRAYAVPWEATTPSEIAALCERLGLETVEVVGFSRLPFVVYNVGFSRVVPQSVIAIETLLRKLLGGSFLTRELFVAVKTTDGGRILRTGPDRVIATNRDGTVVEKSFLGDDTEARRRDAQQEFDRLGQLDAALAQVPGSTTARPLELLPGPPPTIRMDYVAGRPALDVLRAGPLSADRLAGIAATAARALTSYIDVSGEAYFDFQFDNMLFDEPSATVAFIDLGRPHGSDEAASETLPLDASLGNLVGSTIFQSARPKWLFRREQHRQAVQLCTAIVERVAGAAPEQVSAVGIRQVAEDTYRRCAFQGNWPKQLWYLTGGYVVARRMQLRGARFGPVYRRAGHLPGGNGQGEMRSPRSASGRTNRK